MAVTKLKPKPHEEMFNVLDEAQPNLDGHVDDELWGPLTKQLVIAMIDADEDKARAVVETTRKVLGIAGDFYADDTNEDAGDALNWLIKTTIIGVACAARGKKYSDAVHDPEALIAAVTEILKIGAAAHEALEGDE